ncbi:peroxisome proliferator-activated receptor gamma coactivator-related protein 1-like isoform X2 [Morone saxatilis]|uniref:peroxisome proliferator-activated receptor gamma coactivator-related protein 1-like isoform X2 n=1 Tax=Morone saxatilis TaxID=34816 RepID=UPI0015E1EAFA|nr:peroxisome proliferator-activated receptor gamma coactivator-related protein 1-like isoform X2 [Morone saxatilis]
MWSSKMAARWRGTDGNLNAGNSDFLSSNTPNELILNRCDGEVVEMDAQSCVDHSIRAIFEDSAVVSEDKSGAEEESETLLSALTEMLDSVEDVNGTLSPFDTLPDTKLLTHPERRDNSVELSLAERLRPRSKSSNVTFTINIDGEKEDKSKTERKSPPQLYKQQIRTLFHSRNKKAEAEVEVFTTTSLVNLVNLMHPYCLKLHVEEEGDKLRRNHTLFSQEEVWKYERPTEDSDEEINVVSDDEVTVKETKEEEERKNGKLLKSVLLNGNSPRAPPSREKKRVSFGPVQVSSFDQSMEKGLKEQNLTSGHTSETVPTNSTKALENPTSSALEPQTSSSEMNKAEVLPPKGETKAKSLSLQQYRQLRQKRQPLVEKQGNYTTKWPSVSVPPKELTPILCLQGQTQNGFGPKTAHHYSDGRRSGADQLPTPAPPRPHPSEVKPSALLRRSGLKRPRTESKIISPASPLPDVTANLNVIVPESKNSPAKKPTVLSSDPPNPVLLPLPVIQTTSPSTDHSSPPESKVEFLNRDLNLNSIKHFQEIQNESSVIPLQLQPSSLGPQPEVLKPRDCTILFQEIQNKFTKIASGVSSRSPALCPTTTQIQTSSECKILQSQKCSLIPTEGIKLEPKTPLLQSAETVRQTKCSSFSSHISQLPTPVAACIPVKETLPEVLPSKSLPEEPSPPLQFGCRVQSANADSGIEAPDLTSLLEQFEETQAKERVEPKLINATSPSNLQTEGGLNRTEPVGTERASTLPLTPPVETLKPLSTSESPGTLKTLRNILPLQTSEDVDIPEPLGTEIILSTQQDLPARRKNPPSKAIQIIDPRPLPSKKTHSNLSEFPAAHTSPHLYSSISSDHDYCKPVDRSLTSATQWSRTSKLKDITKTTDKLQVSTHNSSTAAECQKQTSISDVDPNIRAVDDSAKSVTQPPSEEPGTRSESADKVLSLSDSAATKQDCVRAAEDKRAPCTLPTPPPSPPVRGRNKRRYRRGSPRSDSSSSSCSSSSSFSSSSSSSASRSPKRQKRHHKRSESSSCSSSCSRSISRSPPRRRYRWSYSRSRCSRSRSRSWSRSRSPSRSRTPSPRICRTQWGDVCSSRESRRLRREHEIRIQKLKAIDERRVVYVGRICRSMTHSELRERFSQFGEVECVSLHFRERGDHYGFVTFYNMDDAFAAIDNGSKLRRPNELPFDLCFGGRRQFCNSDYADLDANRDAEPSPAKSRFEDLDFDSLLKQAQSGLKR